MDADFTKGPLSRFSGWHFGHWPKEIGDGAIRQGLIRSIALVRRTGLPTVYQPIILGMMCYLLGEIDKGFERLDKVIDK